ncbi:MAG: short-chain dehydrogenase [Verrucomicrobia bacterium]|nr:MAG: short-chain dehydrogenase [Verrucomicrobiota bacterium]
MAGTDRRAVRRARRSRPTIFNSALDVERWTFDVFGKHRMKRYLITGASRGIGRAIAEKLAVEDTVLLLHGRDTVALAQTRKAVEPRCAKVILLVHDLAKVSGVSDLIAQVGSGPIDLLVNNAGVAVVKPFTEITPIEWEQTVGVNITAPFLLTQRFVPRMPPGSSVVNILSVAAKTAFPNWSAYCMSKFALEGFSRCVREELRDRKIRVINVYPAATDTEIWDRVEGRWPREKMMSATQVADAVAFALARPTDTLVESIMLSSLAGNL